MIVRTFAIAAAWFALAGAALAQSADASGALNAETGAAPPPTASPATAAAPSASAKPRRTHRRAHTSDAAMNTDAPSASGPDTTTGGAGDTSDLSGSTGATEKMPAGVAPPSPAPPGGAPSGGDVPQRTGRPARLALQREKRAL